MIGYQIEETISRPIAEVFRHVSDPRLHPQWSDVSDVQVATPGETTDRDPGSRDDEGRLAQGPVHLGGH